MNAGVCSYCFNKPFLANEITVPDAIRFVGNETDADCYEPLSRYWDPERDENEQAREAKATMDEVGLTASCYTLDSDFAVYDEEAATECVEICILRLETTQLARGRPNSSGPAHIAAWQYRRREFRRCY